MRKMLPIGIEQFDDIRRNGYYYVDKTGMIEELFHNLGFANLFVRPRRFGKTLNLSMLKSFLSIGTDAALFDGLKISANEELCERHLGQYPVLSLSLKDVNGDNYESAKTRLRAAIARLAVRFDFLASSDALSNIDKVRYNSIVSVDGNGTWNMDDSTLKDSLLTLSELLCKYYGRKVVLLIDEYDVPLDKAWNARNRYYDEMVSLIRDFFSSSLKGNDYLSFSVLTGCMRISKESIFTGLNNLNVRSISDVRFDEYFGFTQDEVREMLNYYGLDEHYDTVEEWYDGYLFGNTNIFCPWDVLKYTDELLADPESSPQDYWATTSGNDLLRGFIRQYGMSRPEELENLIAGETVEKEIHEEMTYRDLNNHPDYIWSILYMTGYLTLTERPRGHKYNLRIPNMEIRELFVGPVWDMFRSEVKADNTTREKLCAAFFDGDPELAEQIFGDYLWRHMSIRSVFVQTSIAENYYHGYLDGLLEDIDGVRKESEKESGTGYGDIILRRNSDRMGVVIELKYARTSDLDRECDKVLEQIERHNYDAALLDEGASSVRKYGIACYKKTCRVKIGR